MEIFLEVQVLLGCLLSLTIPWLFFFNYGHWLPDLGFISHSKCFLMNCCYTAGHCSVRVFSTKQVLFTALECNDSAGILGFRWPKVHCSAWDTWPNTCHICLPPLKPFDSHVEIKEKALKMYCAWLPLPGAFGWLGCDSPWRQYPTFPSALKKDPPEREISLVSNVSDIMWVLL